jgi:hypothetical protein
MKPPVKYKPPDAEVEVEESIEKRVERMRKEEKIKTTELNEVKKRLNNLVNRRSAVISSRFGGPKQDERLGDSCVLHDQIEAEIARITNLKQKQDKGGKKSLLASPLVDNGSATTAEKILLALERSQSDVKDKVCGDRSVWEMCLICSWLRSRGRSCASGARRKPTTSTDWRQKTASSPDFKNSISRLLKSRGILKRCRLGGM